MSVRFSELEGRTVGVWGAGREIRSLAEQLARRLPAARIAVAAFDGAPPGDLREALHAPNLRIVSGAGITAALAGCDVVVRSPGVSTYRPELHALRDAGVAVTTATGLWLGERGGRGVIGVTGTKGKSTTAALISHLAHAAGRDARLVGNIGAPALDLLDAGGDGLAIAELSSYQIADLPAGPEVAVITNLFREHTDWHRSEQAYRSDKLRILTLPGVRHAVVNGRDAQLATRARAAARCTLFGVRDGWDATASGLQLRGRPVLEPDRLPLPGEHNALNLCAALTALEAAGLTPPALPQALAGFVPLPHRLQTVARSGGAVWVDDSISTTPESTLAALASFPGQEIILIAGGQDRGQDYTQLARALAERSATVIGVPTTGPRLLAAARRAGVPASRAIEVPDLPTAVARARERARPGGAILLSPAAPSYDSFRDFEERGERFQALAGAP